MEEQLRSLLGEFAGESTYCQAILDLARQVDDYGRQIEAIKERETKAREEHLSELERIKSEIEVRVKTDSFYEGRCDGGLSPEEAQAAYEQE